MFDAENAGDSIFAAPAKDDRVTEATTAPTATAEAAEATTAPHTTAKRRTQRLLQQQKQQRLAPTEGRRLLIGYDPSWDGSVDISENFDGESAVERDCHQCMGYELSENDWGRPQTKIFLSHCY